MRRISSDVLITSSRSSPGSTNASPLTDAWQSRCSLEWDVQLAQIWQRNRQRWGLRPSRDGSNYWQYYLQLWAACTFFLLHFASELESLLGILSVVICPPLTFLQFTARLLKTICKFLTTHRTCLDLNLAQKNMQRHIHFSHLVNISSALCCNKCMLSCWKWFWRLQIKWKGVLLIIVCYILTSGKLCLNRSFVFIVKDLRGWKSIMGTGE